MFQSKSITRFFSTDAPRKTSFVAIELSDQVSSFIQDDPRTLQNLLPDFSTR